MLEFSPSSLALTLRMKEMIRTHDTHVLQILNDLPLGWLRTHPRGELHCIRIDSSNQGSERRAPAVPQRRVSDVGT
jgi:hypothetical protein